MRINASMPVLRPLIGKLLINNQHWQHGNLFYEANCYFLLTNVVACTDDDGWTGEFPHPFEVTFLCGDEHVIEHQFGNTEWFFRLFRVHRYSWS